MAHGQIPPLECPEGHNREVDGDHNPLDDSQGQAYSVFCRRDKVLVVCLASLAGFFSPFTAFTYFPALRSIADDFDVSIELLNITVTVYLLIQGIVPLLLGDFSENSGRRPAYLLTFSIYCAASVGLALQRNYAALLVLRMVQSAGASGSIGLAYGVIGDIAAPHERGGYVGYAHIGFNCAPAVGPIIGGAIADRAGWPWIFVFVATASGATLVLLGVFLKETARNVVGNGSLEPHGINVSVLQRLQGRGRTKRSDGKRTRMAVRIPNVIEPLKLIFYKTTFPTLFSNAVFYMLFASLQATLAPLVQDIHGLSPFQAGLCYLAFGVSCGVASPIVGKISDRDYRITAKQHNLSIDRRRGDDPLRFPLEEARLRSVFLYASLCAAATIAYGWTLQPRIHLAVPLIMQVIIGFTVTGIFNACNTLIVDINPSRPVIASASVSITRCLFAAGGVAAIGAIVSAIGQGWAFTILGGLGWATLPVMWMTSRNGWAWRLHGRDRDGLPLENMPPSQVTTVVPPEALDSSERHASA